jgi:hypothetical protein
MKHVNFPCRELLLTLILFFCACSSGFSSDTIQSSAPPKEHQKQEERAAIRGGIGAQGTFGLFYPNDINTYTSDLFGSIKDKFMSFRSGNEPHKIHYGYGYSMKADIRALNLIQLELYWDHFYAFPLEVLFEESIMYHSMNATYKYQLSNDEKGISLLFVPGSKKSNTFLTVGGGFGYLQGQFTQSITGYEKLNGVSTDLAETRIYKGTSYAFHGTIGLTFVPWHFLELELVLNGRYALIKTLKDEAGVAFTNSYRDNEPVSLNFSGADLRFGCKFVFP